MGKIKSAICLTLVSLVIAVLCVVCFVPFPTDGEGIHFFNPLVNWMEKSADLGGFQYGGGDPAYVGGSYSVVLYPEGVISAREYADNLAGKGEDEKAEYEGKYVSYGDGAIYLEKEKVCENDVPSEAFKEGFEKRVVVLKERFESLHADSLTLEVRDDYTVRVVLPASMDASVAAFLYFSYMGEVTVAYGTSNDAASAEQILPETGKNAGPVTDYIASISARSNASTSYIHLDFTKKGLETVSEATADAANTSGYLFLKVGDNVLINLSVSEQIHDDLYVSGSYTSDSAAIVAATCSTALKYGGLDPMTTGELHRVDANFTGFGSSLGALELVYIVFGICFVGMAIFFLVRYRRLGFAHLLTYLLFLEVMTVCFWAIGLTGGLSLGVGSLVAFALVSAILCASDIVSYEYVRKEFAKGKAAISAVKTGYKKSFWHIFDLHVALVAAGLLLWLVGLAELSAFGLALALGGFFSALSTMLVNRFLWYIMMPFAKTPEAFCHIKKEEVDDDDD